MLRSLLFVCRFCAVVHRLVVYVCRVLGRWQGRLLCRVFFQVEPYADYVACALYLLLVFILSFPIFFYAQV